MLFLCCCSHLKQSYSCQICLLLFMQRKTKWGLLSILRELSDGYLPYVAQSLGVLVPGERSSREAGGLVRLGKACPICASVFCPGHIFGCGSAVLPCAQGHPALPHPDTPPVPQSCSDSCTRMPAEHYKCCGGFTRFN